MKKMKLKQQGGKPLFIIGIDEVGRGSLAGPLFVCAVVLRGNFDSRHLSKSLPFKDSKKLSPTLRKVWYEKVKESNIPFVLCKIQPSVIDKINVSRAANLATLRCVYKIFKKYKNITRENSQVFLDGGIFVKGGKTIIKGDEKNPAIKLASIIAKVERDNFMIKLSEKYPVYFFDKNKGYGTKKHIWALKKNGLSPCHRKTFCKFLTKKI